MVSVSKFPVFSRLPQKGSGKRFCPAALPLAHSCLRSKSYFFSLAACAIAVSVAASIAGCASNTPAPLLDYQPENFGAHDAFARHYAASPARACEAARRALLSQGFVMDTAQSMQVAGHKYFQPDSNHSVQLAFHVECAAQGPDVGGGTMVFASGLQDQYTLRKTKESASVGVGMLGSLSLPFEGGTDAMVKVASTTVDDKALYQGFFDLVDKLLQSGQVPDMPTPTATVTSAASAPQAASTPAPAPTPAPSAATPPVPIAVQVSMPAPASEPAPAAAPAGSASEAVPMLTPTEVPHAAFDANPAGAPR